MHPRYVPEQHVPPSARHANACELLYGCEDGRIVQLLVDAATVRQGFVIHQGSQPGAAAHAGSEAGAPAGVVAGGGSSSATVTAIHCGADYSKVWKASVLALTAMGASAAFSRHAKWPIRFTHGCDEGSASTGGL